MFKLILKGKKRPVVNVKSQRLFAELLSEGRYHITKSGKVINKITGKTYTRIGNHGYIEIAVRINGIIYRILAHRLVWLHFKGWISVYKLINHKDGVKHNNRISNLEVTTYSGNLKHAWANGLVKNTPNMTFHKKYARRGQRCKTSKLTNAQVDKIRELYENGGYTHRSLAAIYNVNHSCITRAINHTTFKKGFKLKLNNRK